MATRGKDSGNGLYEFPYMRPPQKSGWQAFCDCLYEPAKGTVLGRTGKSWAQILLFYSLFYLGLAALFSICMKVVLTTIDDKEPKWQQGSSLIGANPGMGFRPISDKTEEGSLIWYSKNDSETQVKWSNLLDTFLEPYLKKTTGSNQVQCSFDKLPGSGQSCVVRMDSFGPCSNDNHYGYNTTSPCIFLKLNRIYGFTPEYYNDVNSLPDQMPKDLKDYIKGLEENQRNQIWVTCSGEHPADKENLQPIGFDYYPTRGFANYFYPFKNTENYLSPLVAVKVMEPTVGVLINIECRAWAKNIEYQGGNKDRKGSVHFEVMRD